MKPRCEACTLKHGGFTDGPQVYAVCSRCGIKRACYGDDPEPQAKRKPAIPASVQEWQRERRNYR